MKNGESFDEWLEQQKVKWAAEKKEAMANDVPENYDGASEMITTDDCDDADARAERRRRALICAKALKQFVKAAEKFVEIINEEESDGDAAGILNDYIDEADVHTFDQLIKCARYVDDRGESEVSEIVTGVKDDIDAEMEEEEEEQEQEDDEEFAELEDALAVA